MQGFPWRVLSKVAKFLTLRTQRNEEAARPIFHAEVSDLADRPHRGGWSGVGWGGVGPFPPRFLKLHQLLPGSLFARCLQGQRRPALLMTTLMPLRKD